MQRKHETLLGAIIVLGACSVLSSAQQPQLQPSSPERISQIKADYSAALAQLDKTCDWQFCHDPEARRIWALVGEWLAAYLDAHPTASAADLVATAAELDATRADDVRALRAKAIELGRGDFLVAASYFETGTFFVVGRGKYGQSRVIWSIDRFAISKPADRKLRCWSVVATCGPLYGTISSLPPTATGEPRFYVDANYAGNGMTVGAQTSIWAWTGRDARLLAIGEYSNMIDDGRRIEVDGQTLTVPTKEEPKAFFTAGPSPDPAGTWTLLITPESVKDLGFRWCDAELLWADRFLDALQEKRDTSPAWQIREWPGSSGRL